MDRHERFATGGVREEEFPQAEVRFAIARILAGRRLEPRLPLLEALQHGEPVLPRHLRPLPRGRRDGLGRRGLRGSRLPRGPPPACTRSYVAASSGFLGGTTRIVKALIPGWKRGSRTVRTLTAS